MKGAASDPPGPRGKRTGGEAGEADGLAQTIEHRVAAIGPTLGSAPSAAANGLADLPAGAELSGYRILEIKGVGGMGVVYAAYDPKLDRKVAIKILRTTGRSHSPSMTGAPTAAVLLREAQAMARLSHPNVVTIYQVGTVEDEVFLVMEYIEGQTLARWLSSAKRSRREVVDVLVKAGRGLESAHKAGLIHRDFKPDNVLIGETGEVRVTDFGLARSATDEPPGGQVAGRPSHPIATTSVAGTPAYMAPEQHHGGELDARTDQFAFCATAYEALFGVRPFTGDTFSELAAAKAAGRLHEPASGKRVPRALRQLIIRGLSAAPADRFPTMTDLLRRLDRRPLSKVTAVAGTAVIGAAVAVSAGVLGDRSEPCLGAEERLGSFWNASRKATIADAFAASGLPYASASWRKVEQRLDQYGRSWADTHRDACQATRVRGEQSAEVLDLRMVCLERRRRELETFVDLLAQADRQLIERAVAGAEDLTPIDSCDDVEGLIAALPPPKDPGARQAIAALFDEISGIQALIAAGRYKQAMELGEKTAAAAAPLLYPPLDAEAHLRLGEAQVRAGKLEEGERSLMRAVTEAEIGRSDRVKSKAMLELTYYVGYERGRPAEGKLFGELARSSIARAGGDPQLEAQLLAHVGGVHFANGDYRAAYDSHGQALALRERILGPDHVDVIESLNFVGVMALATGQIEESLAYHRRALETVRRVVGNEHPMVADALNGIGTANARLGHAAEARRDYQEALALFERTLGPDHPRLAISLANLGALAMADGDLDGALSHLDRALAIETKALGREHANLAQTLTLIGECYLTAGRPTQALEPLERAVGILTAAGLSRRVPPIRLTLARALWATGERERARDNALLARKALEEVDDRGEVWDEVAEWLRQHGGAAGR